jgi:hypothetical protein
VCPSTGIVELDLAVLAVHNRMPPGDVHIGTAFLNGCHNDLAELIHLFSSLRIRLASAAQNPLEGVHPAQGQERMVTADEYLARNMPLARRQSKN